MRGDNVPYHPDCDYKNDINDTHTLEQFIIQLIGAKLFYLPF